MKTVLLCALGVGGATVVGAILGFIFRRMSHKYSDATLALGAGIMLAASMLGLVIPSLEHGGKYAVLITTLGIFAGALVINLLDVVVPHLNKFVGVKLTEDDGRGRGVLLFVLAIAIHNFPEGIAAGVGFGSGDTADAILIAGGIALQNIPEGMVIISPMLASGISPAKTFICAALTGFVEVVGTFVGYYAVTLSSALLPFSLALAGGTMLYVISDDMIPETHSHGNERIATYSLLLGFCIMLLFDALF